MKTQYRIRWARVDRGGKLARMCIAERQVDVPFGFTFWWPVGDWQDLESLSERDIDRHRKIVEPLPPPRLIP